MLCLPVDSSINFPCVKFKGFMKKKNHAFTVCAVFPLKEVDTLAREATFINALLPFSLKSKRVYS